MKITNIIVNSTGKFNATIENATANQLAVIARVSAVYRGDHEHTSETRSAPKRKTGKRKTCLRPRCGRGFLSRNKLAKYCSTSCSTKHTLERGVKIGRAARKEKMLLFTEAN